jgi:hypothetical protein
LLEVSNIRTTSSHKPITHAEPESLVVWKIPRGSNPISLLEIWILKLYIGSDNNPIRKECFIPFLKSLMLHCINTIC